MGLLINISIFNKKDNIFAYGGEMLNLINNLDYNGFRYINEHVKGNVYIDYLMIFFAEYAQYMFILLFMILWLNIKIEPV
ncbi:hypothetical protein bmyco0001_22280 [Bacillus mycoides DSM 2048]|nr:hypothetical protein bmyco0001_22280 [Bacillus mycoides DSM 2048]